MDTNTEKGFGKELEEKVPGSIEVLILAIYKRLVEKRCPEVVINQDECLALISFGDPNYGGSLYMTKLQYSAPNGKKQRKFYVVLDDERDKVKEFWSLKRALVHLLDNAGFGYGD